MFSEVALLSGLDFEIEIKGSENIKFIHPKLSHILEVGDNNYFNFANIFCLEPHDRMIQLWDEGIDFEETTSFDIFKDSISKDNITYSKLFNVFSNISKIMVSKNGDIIYYEKESNNGEVFTLEIFNEIASFYKEIHIYIKTKPPKFKDNSVKDLYIELEKEEMEDRNTPSFGKTISSLIWSENCSYKYSEIWDLYMYQFKVGLVSVSDIKDHQFLMTGIYNGTVDDKKVESGRLNWIRNKK